MAVLKALRALALCWVFPVHAQPLSVTELYMLLPNSIYDVTNYPTEEKTEQENRDQTDNFHFRRDESDADKTALVAAHRRSLITVLDLKNNYIKLTRPRNGDHWAELGLWVEIIKLKTKDSSNIVAISQTDDCDGPAYQLEVCQAGLFFLKYANNKWTDLSEQIFPGRRLPKSAYSNFTRADDRFCQFRLPRNGTELRLLCNNYTERRKVNNYSFITSEGRFTWDGVKFKTK